MYTYLKSYIVHCKFVKFCFAHKIFLFKKELLIQAIAKTLEFSVCFKAVFVLVTKYCVSMLFHFSLNVPMLLLF